VSLNHLLERKVYSVIDLDGEKIEYGVNICSTQHQLVLWAVKGSPPVSARPLKYSSIDHIDCDRCNNDANNLRWSHPHEQNMNQKRKKGDNMCIVQGCINLVITQSNCGKCVDHGGKIGQCNRLCRIGNCTKLSQYEGMCLSHAGPNKTRCSVSECDNFALSKKGTCKRHTSGVLICSTDTCGKRANRRGLCTECGQDQLCSVTRCRNLATFSGRCTRHSR